MVTYYTLFVIELHSRRVHIVGSPPHPDEAFMLQIVRDLTDATDGVLGGPCFLICDRDQKWSADVRQRFEMSGVRAIRRPYRGVTKVFAPFTPRGSYVTNDGDGTPLTAGFS